MIFLKKVNKHSDSGSASATAARFSWGNSHKCLSRRRARASRLLNINAIDCNLIHAITDFFSVFGSCHAIRARAAYDKRSVKLYN